MFRPLILDVSPTHYVRGIGSNIRVVGGTMASTVSRAYNGSLGAEPPARSRGRVSGQGVRRAKPLKLKAF